MWRRFLPDRNTHRLTPLRRAWLAGLMACVGAAAAWAVPGPIEAEPDDQQTVRLEVISGTTGTALSGDGTGVVLPGPGEARIRLRFELPPPLPGDSPWLIRLGRDSLPSVRLESGGWTTPTRGFFSPAADERFLPNGYKFRLPPTWNGPKIVDLVVTADSASVVRPQVLRESILMQREHRSIAVVSAIYACLAALALIGVSLFGATRDRAFLSMFGFLVAALGLLLSKNGHLYALPGVGHFAIWGVAGVWAMLLVAAAGGVWVMQNYAALGTHAPRLNRLMSRMGVGLLVLAAVCLLNLPGTQLWLQWIATLGWVAAVAAAMAASLVGVRWRLWMAAPIFALLVLLALAGGMYELMLRDHAPSGFWIRHGYQVVLALLAMALTIGLTGRITEFRAARDRDRLARDDSERRLEREAARAELVQTLQKKLRELPPGDMEWAAFRSLFERLLPLLELEAGALIAYGYHGFDLLLAEPLQSKEHFTALLSNRVGMMKGLARTRAPLQLPLEDEGTSMPAGDDDGQGNGGEAAHNPRVSGVHRRTPRRIHAVVPLPIRAPGWGVLLLERSGDRAFSHDELTLASEFGRLAVQHADEAANALSLRRSAELDSLTGALNRRTIDLWLARSFADAHRNQQALAVLFVDLDHFKNVNDTYGHACGDLCLRKVAETLRRELQPGDLLGRYGGEEFLVLLPGRNGDTARQLGELIRAAVEREEIECNGSRLRMTVSVGVATRLDREDIPNPTVERADKALYVAKRAGRNRVSVAPAIFD